MVARPLTLDEVEHWELFGGRCRLVEIADDHAVVELCTCTNELVERRRSDDAALIDELRQRAGHVPD